MYLEGKSSLKSEKVVNRGELAFSFFFTEIIIFFITTINGIEEKIKIQLLASNRFNLP